MQMLYERSLRLKAAQLPGLDAHIISQLVQLAKERFRSRIDLCLPPLFTAPSAFLPTCLFLLLSL